MLKNLAKIGIPLMLLATPAIAQDAPIETWQFNINTLFVMVCGILVMWMAAGFTMLEVGFVRAQSVVSQCAKNMGLFAIASFCFLLIGYGLMFPNSWIVAGVIGAPGPLEIAPVADATTDIGTKQNPTATSAFFNMMFCAAVASIVSGSLAERIRLMPFFIFVAVMTAFIYPIQASWAWGGGFLASTLGFQDLAGSAVIHVVGGVAAMTGAMFLGPRLGRFVDGKKVAMQNFNLPLATLGALILWMGWFGFNAGSYLSFSSEADATNVARIMLNTNMAAASGALTAAVISYMRDYRFDLSFMINGALGGLVAITADPLYPEPMFAAVAGMAAGLVVFWSLALLDKLMIDDVVGAIPVHLFCGILGTLIVPLNNPDATIVGQTAGLMIIIAFVAAATSAVWFILNKTFGLRVSAEREMHGIDDSTLVMET